MIQLNKPLTELQEHILNAEYNYDIIHEKLLYVNIKMGNSMFNSICYTITLCKDRTQIDKSYYYKTLQTIGKPQKRIFHPNKVDPYGEYSCLKGLHIQ